MPVVPLEVASHPYEAILDTGFEGGLQLPDRFRSIVTGPLIRQDLQQYGDGSIGVVEIFEITVRFDGEDRAFPTQFSASNEYILGVEALRDYRLEINFVTGSVILDRVATP